MDVRDIDFIKQFTKDGRRIFRTGNRLISAIVDGSSNDDVSQDEKIKELETNLGKVLVRVKELEIDVKVVSSSLMEIIPALDSISLRLASVESKVAEIGPDTVKQLKQLQQLVTGFKDANRFQSYIEKRDEMIDKLTLDDSAPQFLWETDEISSDIPLVNPDFIKITYGIPYKDLSDGLNGDETFALEYRSSKFTVMTVDQDGIQINLIDINFNYDIDGKALSVLATSNKDGQNAELELLNMDNASEDVYTVVLTFQKSLVTMFVVRDSINDSEIHTMDAFSTTFGNFINIGNIIYDDDAFMNFEYYTKSLDLDNLPSRTDFIYGSATTDETKKKPVFVETPVTISLNEWFDISNTVIEEILVITGKADNVDIVSNAINAIVVKYNTLAEDGDINASNIGPKIEEIQTELNNAGIGAEKILNVPGRNEALTVNLAIVPRKQILQEVISEYDALYDADNNYQCAVMDNETANSCTILIWVKAWDIMVMIEERTSALWAYKFVTQEIDLGHVIGTEEFTPFIGQTEQIEGVTMTVIADGEFKVSNVLAPYVFSKEIMGVEPPSGTVQAKVANLNLHAKQVTAKDENGGDVDTWLLTMVGIKDVDAVLDTVVLSNKDEDAVFAFENSISPSYPDTNVSGIYEDSQVLATVIDGYSTDAKYVCSEYAYSIPLTYRTELTILLEFAGIDVSGYEGSIMLNGEPIQLNVVQYTKLDTGVLINGLGYTKTVDIGSYMLIAANGDEFDRTKLIPANNDDNYVKNSYTCRLFEKDDVISTDGTHMASSYSNNRNPPTSGGSILVKKPMNTYDDTVDKDALWSQHQYGRWYKTREQGWGKGGFIGDTMMTSRYNIDMMQYSTPEGYATSGIWGQRLAMTKQMVVGHTGSNSQLNVQNTRSNVGPSDVGPNNSSKQSYLLRNASEPTTENKVITCTLVDPSNVEYILLQMEPDLNDPREWRRNDANFVQATFPDITPSITEVRYPITITYDKLKLLVKPQINGVVDNVIDIGKQLLDSQMQIVEKMLAWGLDEISILDVELEELIKEITAEDIASMVIQGIDSIASVVGFAGGIGQMLGVIMEVGALIYDIYTQINGLLEDVGAGLAVFDQLSNALQMCMMHAGKRIKNLSGSEIKKSFEKAREKHPTLKAAVWATFKKQFKKFVIDVADDVLDADDGKLRNKYDKIKSTAVDAYGNLHRLGQYMRKFGSKFRTSSVLPRSWSKHHCGVDDKILQINNGKFECYEMTTFASHGLTEFKTVTKETRAFIAMANVFKKNTGSEPLTKSYDVVTMSMGDRVGVKKITNQTLTTNKFKKDGYMQSYTSQYMTDLDAQIEDKGLTGLFSAPLYWAEFNM